MPESQNVTTSSRAATMAWALGTGTALLLALTGCSELTASSKIEQRHFATHADTPTTGDLAWVLADWVPKDASDIDIKLNASYPGYDLRFTSAEGVDFTRCQALDETYGGPALDADFLPDPVPTTGLFTCGDGRVATASDGKYYSWTTKEPIPGTPAEDDRTARVDGATPTPGG